MATATQENGALRPQNGIYLLLIPADILQSTTTTSVLSKNTIAAWPKAASRTTSTSEAISPRNSCRLGACTDM